MTRRVKGRGGRRKERDGDYKEQGGGRTHEVLYFWLCGGHTQTGLMESFHISAVDYHQGSFQEISSKLTEQTSHLEL